MKLTWEDDEKLQITVQFDRWDSLQSDRARLDWIIACDGEVLAKSDYDSQVQVPASESYGILAEGLEALGSFLSAWHESTVGGENYNLFPTELREYGIDWDSVAMELQWACREGLA